ncbi:O-antigen ligase family protein [Candidatus Nitronereus thalassa]|uniref:O-antigen ligase family protein n=1 Tax=Candidatus Nitronereus thalassa TaxID=3020898 RepID=A0ABU3K5J9_9BACT|nr:O-antigen ligase family protein [Candidatus Nitronereus thalassa]MDT7041656.1 O-antigen ligase family protein [Candidatus Nitronereus thalassa]
MQVFSVLVFFCGISVFFNSNKTYWFGFASYCLSFVAFIVVRSLFSSRYLGTLNILLSVFLFLSGIISILQVFYGAEFYVVNLFSDENYHPPYAVGLGLNSPNIMGLFILWALGVQACNLIIYSEHHKAGWFPWVAFIFGVCGVYFTVSRSVWLGLGIFLLVLLISLVVKGHSLHAFGRILVVVFLSFLVCNQLPTRSDTQEMHKIKWDYIGGPGIKSHVYLWDYISDPGVRSRLYLWNLAAKAIYQQSVFGSGIGNFEDYLDINDKSYIELGQRVHLELDMRPKISSDSPLLGPHNSIAEFILDFGVLAGGVAMSLILFIMFSGMRHPIDHPAHIFSLALVGVIIGMQFNDLSKERLLWIGLAIIASLSFARPSNQEEIASIEPTTQKTT